MSRAVDVWSSFAASAARGVVGTFATARGRRPESLIEVYEFEACPWCRRVREALTALDLDAMIYPCPKGGERYRPRVAAMGGKTQFPYIVDPNTGFQSYESADIVRYLFDEYGDGSPRVRDHLGPFTGVTGSLASALRFGRGRKVTASREPAEPLELYSFESSPFSRLVREELCELELPYVLHNVGKGATIDWLPVAVRRRFTPHAPPSTRNRAALVERGGHMMVPFLVDPNTGTSMYESDEIVRYLRDVYAA